MKTSTPSLLDRSRRARPALLSALAVALGVAYSCGEADTSDAPPFDEERAAMLTSTSVCATEAARDFALEVAALEADIGAWSEDSESDALLTAARDAWDAAMTTWQTMEPLQLGPTGPSGSTDQGGVVGGQDLRDEIYSWPLVNQCRIDQLLVDRTYEDELASQNVNARGLDALEYLLFEHGDESACPPTANIIVDGSWAALTDLSERRIAYAKSAVALLRDAADRHAEAWGGADGFADVLADAGRGDGPYDSQAEALNAVTDALFYVESMTKDRKLALVLGIHDDCADATCPEKVEHPESGRSKQSVLDNIAGFERVFRGCGSDAVGLETLLRNQGGARVAEEIDAALAEIAIVGEAIEEDDLREALAADPDSVTALHDAIKTLTDLLKEELPVVLDVDLPEVVGGDND